MRVRVDFITGTVFLIAASVLLCGCASPRAEARASERQWSTHSQPAETVETEARHHEEPVPPEPGERGRTEDDPPEPIEPSALRTIEPFEDIRVHLHEPSVEIRAWVCIEAGFLEQIACSPGTREHESLVVVRAKPSNIHASLLLAGFEPGSPGRWVFDPDAPEDKQLKLIPPTGEKLSILVRYERAGEEVEEPISNWVRDHHDLDRRLPDVPWVFGGSMFRENPEFMGSGEHYVADMTGSIIGLVTFGDEVIGFREVISDQAAIHEPEWEVDIEHIPDFATEVRIILRPAE